MTEIGKVLEGMMPFPKIEGGTGDAVGEASEARAEREGGGEAEDKGGGSLRLSLRMRLSCVFMRPKVAGVGDEEGKVG